METFKRLLKLARPHLPKFLLALLCMLVVGVSTSSLAFLVKPALDDIFFKKDLKALVWIPIIVVGIYLIKGLCSYGQVVIMNYIGLRIVADLRRELYRKIQNQSLSFFTRNPTGVLMSRITNDVGYIQSTVSEAITSLFKDTFTLIGLIFVIFYRNWKLAIIATFVLPLVVYPIAQFGRKMRNVALRSQMTMGNLNTLLHETFTGTRIVKAFGMEEYENRRFAEENEKLFKLNIKTTSIHAASSPFMEFLGGIGIAVIVAYGGYEVIRGGATPGTFFSFLTALIMLYEPIKRLTNVNNTIQQGIAGAQRVFDILDTEEETKDKPDAVEMKDLKEGIEFRNVTFAYDSQPVLKNINLFIKASEIVAFVGMSGGGKTTLVNLIPRFYDVTEGQILIDGRDIRDYNLASLRQKIGIVTQETILFNDTVKNNIAYGDMSRTDEEIIEAAKAAYAHDFIMELPEGYNTIIGEKGARLSGGERQRIAIARALLKNPPILILDEATSSLDTEAEIEVQKALDNLMKGKTTLLVAHRLSTIRNADRIVVMTDGEIVEVGTHEELLAKRGEYYKLYNLQFAEEERSTKVHEKT
ncbi:MAG: lipid A export permease/ATP-binding protein MsbA [Syntrophales bacterium]|nr:lipid A export permease/ATP-binding protein MsbA [Syntrophales bacterium]